tara:strand:+ start:9829 stop:11919 length:2091 start_codon:yes stop_codon:yes gene_type:complete
MDESKNIVIKITLTGDGKVKLDQVTGSVQKLTKATKDQEKAAKGSEAALKQQIRELMALRAANATTAKSYAAYSKQIDKVQKELTQLQAVQKEAIQTNADQISSSGLAGATLNEFGRFISDLPFGITAVTNNLSQLANLFVILSAKVNGGKKAFQLLMAQLRGPLGLIIAFQVIIALVQGFQKQLLILLGITNKQKEAQKEFNKALKESQGAVQAEALELEGFVRILKDSNSSREAQQNAIEQLSKALPHLTKQQIANKDSIDETTAAVKALVEQKMIQVEIDTLLDKNQEVLSMRSELRRINAIKDEDEFNAATLQFVKDNKLRFEAFSETLGENVRAILRFERFDFADSRRVLLEGLTQTLDGVEEKVFELQNKLSPGPGTPDKRDRITPFVFGANVKRNLGKTTKEINEEIEKMFDKISDSFGVQTFSEQFKALQENAGNAVSELANQELTREENHKKELERIKTEFDKRNELANNITGAVTKLSQIQDQAFQSQIKRLDTERDVILNNDNLTSEEKDRLLKKNDKETREVRTKQIKFERDMHMIEMSMELAKIGLQIQNAMTTVTVDATGAVSKASMSLGAFMNQLGPFGIAAYAASIGGVIATIVSARKKAQQQIQALSNESLAVSGGGGGASGIQVSAPDFNVVGATQTSQLAQTIAGAEDKPIKAFVVASDVTTAQELERSTIEGASLG